MKELDLTEAVNKIDWKKGIVSKEEAERFVNRFARVLLQQATIKDKKDENCDT